MIRLIFLFLTIVNVASAALNPITTDLPPSSNVSDEIMALDNLIVVTEQNLAAQKKLREQISSFQAFKQQYLKNLDSRESAYNMIQSARLVLQSIKNNYLEQMFSPEFISELTFFSQLASKQEQVK